MSVEIVNDETRFTLTTNANIPDNQKILYIDTVENFDLFTNLYGYTDANFLDIHWTKVFNDFQGFKLNSSLFYERFFNAHYNGKEYISWWDSGYYYDNHTIILKK